MDKHNMDDESSPYTDRAGLQVDKEMARFFDEEVIAPLSLESDQFWTRLTGFLARFSVRNKELLAERESLQNQMDAWHKANPGPVDKEGYAAYDKFLREIGYLVAEPEPFTIGTQNVDSEITMSAGPQLVVPALNDRFVLNAVNARWGSLYDAYYGTDALKEAPDARTGGYDPVRGEHVIKAGKAFLDKAIPLAMGSWADLTHIDDKKWENGAILRDPTQYIGQNDAGKGRLFRHNGLYIEVVFDAGHFIGRDDRAGIADIIVESALTTIIDMEDSVAAVDAQDKLVGYRNWLGLMRGDLKASFSKGEQIVTRRANRDRQYKDINGKGFILPGRSLLFVRNVGHLMTNPAVLLPDGSEAPEGLLDAAFTSLIAMHDLNGLGELRNSRTGSIYIVKPKMHGPKECAFTNDIFGAVEDMLDLPRHAIKVGVMDEERRTSANLGACIFEVRDRLIFINTGFLDRTGDEIHTALHGGAMIAKGAMKSSEWITAYEDRNVSIGLAHGLSGRAQIGKGMWAAPDKMADMMEQKIAHPQSGANTAWVPSPTAATLHALHYHEVDVFSLHDEIKARPITTLSKLLHIPFAGKGVNWSAHEVERELENNAQSILGYVVRWIDQGVGCSKVPDIMDVGLMEDRATLRISSQHMANWLLHGVCSAEQVDRAFLSMAAKVDAQNADDPFYKPMAKNPEKSLAYQAARDLIFAGARQPSGYTEPFAPCLSPAS